MKYLKYINNLNLDPFDEEWDEDEIQINSHDKKNSISFLKNVFDYICFNFDKNKRIYLDKLLLKIPKYDSILELYSVDEFTNYFYKINDYEIDFDRKLYRSIKITIIKDENTIHIYPFVSNREKYGVIVIFNKTISNYNINTKRYKSPNNGYIIITPGSNRYMLSSYRLKNKLTEIYNKLDKFKFNKYFSIKNEYKLIIKQLNEIQNNLK